MKYRVSRQGQEAGQFTLDEIVAMVRSKQLELFDHIFDAAKNDWILLVEHAELTAQLRSFKPQSPAVDSTPANAAASPAMPAAQAGGEWYVLKGEHKFGPFNHTELVRMLQQKALFPFDFVWRAELSDWRRVAEVPEFQPERIRAMIEQEKSKKGSVFAQRKHKRKKLNTQVFLHDNLSLWKGETVEISKGGAGVKIEDAPVVPGQKVFAHFSGVGGLPSFNAVCEVVSKKFVTDGSPAEYGLKFLELSLEDEDDLDKKVAA